jgi:hypothetical protein
VGWDYFYRYYLQFMYLNNAYHFYSPEPGPPTLLWFAVRYEGDDTIRWIKMPERSLFRTREEYQRRLSITENANMNLNPQEVPPPIMQQLLIRRGTEGHRLSIPTGEETPSPVEFREPSIYSKKLLESYARHVARSYPSEKNPSAQVASVKIYRVVHNILEPYQMGAGFPPDHPLTYLPFFMGDFDRDGNLKDPADPFLYWYIPIKPVLLPAKEPPPGMPPPDPHLHPEMYQFIDYTVYHAALVTRPAGPPAPKPEGNNP